MWRRCGSWDSTYPCIGRMHGVTVNGTLREVGSGVLDDGDASGKRLDGDRPGRAGAGDPDRATRTGVVRGGVGDRAAHAVEDERARAGAEVRGGDAGVAPA